MGDHAPQVSSNLVMTNMFYEQSHRLQEYCAPFSPAMFRDEMLFEPGYPLWKGHRNALTIIRKSASSIRQISLSADIMVIRSFMSALIPDHGRNNSRW